MSLTVAAVVPVRNRKDKTLRFLQEFAKQTYPHICTIVVDSNSTDGTQDEIISSFPQVTLLHADDECYWTAATNIGIQRALQLKCDYILTINDDAFVMDHYVGTLVGIAQKHNLPILGSRVDYLTNPGLIWSLGAYSVWGTKHLFQLRYNQNWEDDLPASVEQNEAFEVEALAGNGVLIHRSVFDQIGLYNYHFLPHYHADSELIMLAKSLGIQPFVTPTAIVYNDCPSPFQSPRKSDDLELPNSLWKDFYFNFFHKRSHLFLPPTIYVIAKYCPNHQKIPTFLKAVIIYPVYFLLASILNKKFGINPHQIKARVKKALKSTIHWPNRLLGLRMVIEENTWQTKKR